MPIYLQFSIPGRNIGRGKGAVYAMAYGPNKITPRNLSQSLFKMATLSHGTGADGKGNDSNNPIVIVKQRDSSSTQLFHALSTQELLPAVQLNFIRSGGTGGKEQVVSKITLTNAVISRVNQFRPTQFVPPKKPKLGGSTENNNSNELEEFQLTFQKIDYSNVFNSRSASDDWTK
jgi:type VI secretion system Hcp family effector